MQIHKRLSIFFHLVSDAIRKLYVYPVCSGAIFPASCHVHNAATDLPSGVYLPFPDPGKCMYIHTDLARGGSLEGYGVTLTKYYELQPGWSPLRLL